MSSQINLDAHIRKCISIITTCIALVLVAFSSIFTFVTFFDTHEGPSVREIHMKQHQDEGERLDKLVSVLESINAKLDKNDE